MTWQSIETAPLRTAVLVYWPIRAHVRLTEEQQRLISMRATVLDETCIGISFAVAVGGGQRLWHRGCLHLGGSDSAACYEAFSSVYAAEPSHWMPLPEPPANSVNTKGPDL